MGRVKLYMLAPASLHNSPPNTGQYRQFFGVSITKIDLFIFCLLIVCAIFTLFAWFTRFIVVFYLANLHTFIIVSDVSQVCTASSAKQFGIPALINSCNRPSKTKYVSKLYGCFLLSKVSAACFANSGDVIATIICNALCSFCRCFSTPCCIFSANAVISGLLISILPFHDFVNAGVPRLIPGNFNRQKQIIICYFFLF